MALQQGGQSCWRLHSAVQGCQPQGQASCGHVRGHQQPLPLAHLYAEPAWAPLSRRSASRTSTLQHSSDTCFPGAPWA